MGLPDSVSRAAQVSTDGHGEQQLEVGEDEGMRWRGRGGRLETMRWQCMPDEGLGLTALIRRLAAMLTTVPVTLGQSSTRLEWQERREVGEAVLMVYALRRSMGDVR